MDMNKTESSPNSSVLEAPTITVKKGVKFWLIIISLCLTLFLAALEFTAVGTTLPSIVADLHGTNFVWVGSAYALASSALLPMTGGIVQTFGRKPAILASIILFALGSALCGAAQNMNMLIGGRTVQGIGGGGILSFSAIIMADITPLNERGLYNGLFGLTWGLAAAIGPIIGGALANAGQWRWLFYLNLPLCGLSGVLTVLFLHLPSPPGTWKDKISRMDWIGNVIVVGSACAITIALAMGGVQHPWNSAQILAPLIIGVAGLVVFLVYEGKLAKYPIVPFDIISNRTSLTGYVLLFFGPITLIAPLYYLPVYFQACKGSDALISGVQLLGLSATPLGNIIGGISVNITQRYRPQIWISWSLMLVGMSLFTLIKVKTSVGLIVLFCLLFGLGNGSSYALGFFPVQAPLPVESSAHALALITFIRTFAGVWGVTLGGAILQNELKRRLPTDFTASFPQGIELVYSAIPQIGNLPEPLKSQVQEAFAQSVRKIWIALASIVGAGLLVSTFVKEFPLHKTTDDTWTPNDLKEDKEKANKKLDSEVTTAVTVA